MTDSTKVSSSLTKWKDRAQRKRARNLVRAIEQVDDGKWTKHTEHHWSRPYRTEDGRAARLHFWPSTDRYRIEVKPQEAGSHVNALDFLLREVIAPTGAAESKK